MTFYGSDKLNLGRAGFRVNIFFIFLCFDQQLRLPQGCAHIPTDICLSNSIN